MFWSIRVLSNWDTMNMNIVLFWRRSSSKIRCLWWSASTACRCVSSVETVECNYSILEQANSKLFSWSTNQVSFNGVEALAHWLQQCMQVAKCWFVSSLRRWLFVAQSGTNLRCRHNSMMKMKLPNRWNAPTQANATSISKNPRNEPTCKTH